MISGFELHDGRAICRSPQCAQEAGRRYSSAVPFRSVIRAAEAGGRACQMCLKPLAGRADDYRAGVRAQSVASSPAPSARP